MLDQKLARAPQLQPHVILQWISNDSWECEHEGSLLTRIATISAVFFREN